MVASAPHDPAFEHPAMLWTVPVNVHLDNIYILYLSSKQSKRCAGKTIRFRCGASCWTCGAWLLPQLCKDLVHKGTAVLWTVLARVHFDEIFISGHALSSKRPKRCAGKTIHFRCGAWCFTCGAWLLPQLCRGLVHKGSAVL